MNQLSQSNVENNTFLPCKDSVFVEVHITTFENMGSSRKYNVKKGKTQRVSFIFPIDFFFFFGYVHILDESKAYLMMIRLIFIMNLENIVIYVYDR